MGIFSRSTPRAGSAASHSTSVPKTSNVTRSIVSRSAGVSAADISAPQYIRTMADASSKLDSPILHRLVRPTGVRAEATVLPAVVLGSALLLACGRQKPPATNGSDPIEDAKA